MMSSDSELCLVMVNDVLSDGERCLRLDLYCLCVLSSLFWDRLRAEHYVESLLCKLGVPPPKILTEKFVLGVCY